MLQPFAENRKSFSFAASTLEDRWRHTAEKVSSRFHSGMFGSKPSWLPDACFSLLVVAGDLGFHLQHLGIFTKVMAQYYTARTVLGIRHLHQKGIVYRDLKPENVMLDEYGRSRISDMGLACKVTPHLTGACGTRGCEFKQHSRSIYAIFFCINSWLSCRIQRESLPRSKSKRLVFYISGFVL